MSFTSWTHGGNVIIYIMYSVLWPTCPRHYGLKCCFEIVWYLTICFDAPNKPQSIINVNPFLHPLAVKVVGSAHAFYPCFFGLLGRRRNTTCGTRSTFFLSNSSITILNNTIFLVADINIPMITINSHEGLHGAHEVERSARDRQNQL